MNTTIARPAGIAATLVVSASLLTFAAPAQASGGGGGDDVVRRGSCAGATDWKVKVKPDDGKLEVEGEVDSNHVGQTWRWRLVHNGSLSSRGTRTTQGPSGSFEVHRRMNNLAGTDTVTLRARNVNSGELCVGRVRY